MGKKRVGEWILLHSEVSQSFIQYAKKSKKNTDYYQNYNRSVFKKLILPWLSKTGNKRRLAIDIGASYGFMSHGLLKHFQKVNAFELMESVRYCLRENLGNASRLKIYDCGLGSSIESVEATFYPKYTGHCSVIDNVNYQGIKKKSVCEVVPLDLFQFDAVDFIKIDVEGYELEVLKGAKKTIERNSPLLLIEILRNNPFDTAMKVNKFLSEMGYTLLDSHNEDFLFGKV